MRSYGREPVRSTLLKISLKGFILNIEKTQLEKYIISIRMFYSDYPVCVNRWGCFDKNNSFLFV